MKVFKKAKTFQIVSFSSKKRKHRHPLRFQLQTQKKVV